MEKPTITSGSSDHGGMATDLDRQEKAHDSSVAADFTLGGDDATLHRGLKSRHIQFLALGMFARARFAPCPNHGS
jgi:amino acid permease